MKKFIALILSLTFVLTLDGCGKATGSGESVVGGADVSETESDIIIEPEQTQQAVVVDELPDEGAIIVTNIFTTQSKSLSDNDGLTITDILESDSWNTEGTSDCMSNIEVTMSGTIYKYHSDCGTFNDSINQRSLSLDEKTQNLVNNILENYISLTSEDVQME